MAVCQLRQPRENTVCLLLRLLCQPGENERVCSSGLFECSSSFPALAFPTLDSVNREIQQDSC